MKRPDQLSRFIADLTSSDQLSTNERSRAAANERRHAASELRHAIYEARMLAIVAFHRAKAASMLACCARVSGWDDAELLSTEECLSVDELIRATDRYMRLPIRNKEDEKGRHGYLKQWSSAATTIQTSPKWSAAKAQYIAILDAATLGARP